MPFNPLKDGAASDPPKRVMVTDDQGQLLDGGIRTYVWDVASLAWVRATQASVTISSLAVTVGSINGLVTVTGAVPTLSIGVMPAITIGSTNGQVSIVGSPTVVVGNSTIAVTESGAWGVTASVNGWPTVSVGNSVAVTGTFWQATQPVSFASPTVSVGNIPAVSQSGVWGVTATVNIGSAVPTISIGNIPAVSQSGAWTATATVNIGSTLPAFAAVPTVWVGSLPSVNGVVSVASLVNLGTVPSFNGVVSVASTVTIVHGKTLKTAYISLNGTGNVVAGVAGKVLKVYSARVIASASTAVKFQDNTTDLEGAQQLTATGGFVETTVPPAFLFKTTASLPLALSIVPSALVGGRVSYWDDDAS